MLGTPSIKDPFHDDRWDYVQTFSRRGGAMVQRTITLLFEDDLLETIIGLDEPFGEQLDDGLKGLRAPGATDTDGADGDGADDTDDTATDDATDTSVDDTATDAPAQTIVVKEPVEPEIEGLGERESETRDVEEDPDAIPDVIKDGDFEEEGDSDF